LIPKRSRITETQIDMIDTSYFTLFGADKLPFNVIAFAVLFGAMAFAFLLTGMIGMTSNQRIAYNRPLRIALWLIPIIAAACGSLVGYMSVVPSNKLFVSVISWVSIMLFWGISYSMSMRRHTEWWLQKFRNSEDTAARARAERELRFARWTAPVIFPVLGAAIGYVMGA